MNIIDIERAIDNAKYEIIQTWQLKITITKDLDFIFKVAQGNENRYHFNEIIKSILNDKKVINCDDTLHGTLYPTSSMVSLFTRKGGIKYYVTTVKII